MPTQKAAGRTRRPTDKSSPAIDPRLARVIHAFAAEPTVAYGGGKGFGSATLKAGSKIFVFVSPGGRLVAKLPAVRVDDFVARRKGRRFDAGRGTPMREWLELTDATGASWVDVARESFQFVNGARR